MSTSSESRLHVPRCAMHLGGGLLAVLFAAAGWCIVERPMAHRQAELAEQIKQAFDLAHSATELRQRHRMLLKDFEVLSARIGQLESKLTASTHPSQVFEQISALAQQTDVSVHDYRPAQPLDADSVRQHTVQLSVSGDYESLCRFFVKLEDLPLLCKTSQIKMTSTPGKGGTLSVELGLQWSAAVQTAKAS
jgi:Tfp pilus assembly protein PilO